MKDLLLFPIGKDRFDRPVYLSPRGNAIVDIDNRDPRKDLRTKWPPKDAYYSEPDCHLEDDLRPVFMDTVIETANTAKEMAGDPDRYQLKGTRVFVCNDIATGDDFEELNEKQVNSLVNFVEPVLFDGHEIQSLVIPLTK